LTGTGLDKVAKFGESIDQVQQRIKVLAEVSKN
jgi:hypothetical protein